MKIKEILLKYLNQTGIVLGTELKTIFHDGGVMLILVLAIFIYSILYSCGYNNQVLRGVPVAVVDDCDTQESQAVRDLFDASPNMHVAYEVPDMAEAMKLFYERKVYGAIYFPEDYAKKVLSGQQANVSIYCDASYFLMYRQVFQDVVASISKQSIDVKIKKLTATGIDPYHAKGIAQPVIYQSQNLFNPYLGYGTYVMPAIMLVIIQQTALLGIGMIAGTWKEFNLYEKLLPTGDERFSTIPIVMGKVIAYSLIYALTSAYVFTVHYHIFGYPMNGTAGTCLAVLIPYVLACILFAITVSTLFTKREHSIMWLLWISIPTILLTGCSFPKEAIPEWMFTFGKILPSSTAVDAFLRAQTGGAPLIDLMPAIRTLWRLVLIYGATALISMHFVLNQDVAQRIARKLRRKKKS